MCMGVDPALIGAQPACAATRHLPAAYGSSARGGALGLLPTSVMEAYLGLVYVTMVVMRS